MYTDQQIAKMTPKVHPAIKMAPTWGSSISKEEYAKKIEALKVWTFKESAYIEKKYDSDLFPKIVSTGEIIPFLKAGFELDFKYISNLTYHSQVIDGLSFSEQDLCYDLVQVRENITIIGLTVNALSALNNEFGSHSTVLKEKSMEILKLAKDLLTLLAQGKIGQVPYLSKIEKMMKEDCKSDIIPTATYIKTLKSIKQEASAAVYKQKTHRVTKNSDEATR